MDSSIQREVDNYEPAIPFRYTSNHAHHTWARTFHSYPELYLRPQSTAEIQKIVTLARRCRRRLTTVGCGHSPSTLTCTSSWLVNLDDYSDVLSVDQEKNLAVIQSGIRLADLGKRLKSHGLAMRSLGSIDDQSIAGAIATATHGSSLRHGLLSESVKALKIMLANGRTVLCSAEQNTELFQAALVSLGALGIIIEVTFEAVPSFDIEWSQSLHPLSDILASWNTNLWTQAEFVRVWWLPHGERGIIWKADKTSKARHAPKSGWYGSIVGYHTYQSLLYLSNWIPQIIPSIEWFVFGMQFGFSPGKISTGVEESHPGLLMDCLYSQLVNEWAIPLEKGPEALTRLSAWLHGNDAVANIPVSSKGIYVHAPIEVRVTDTSQTSPRPLLDTTNLSGPTLFLNAILYRPYGTEPRARERYYAAFEYLMKELGGRPHWAKNFSNVSHEDFQSMYGERLAQWARVRNTVDPEGMFVGEWHRQTVLSPQDKPLPLEEKEVCRVQNKAGGWDVKSEPAKARPSRPASEESFDLMHGAEAEASTYLTQDTKGLDQSSISDS